MRGREQETEPSPADQVERRVGPALGAALSLIVVFVVVLGIPLDAAAAIGLSPGETVSWIIAVYGLSGALSILFSIRYRQPLLFTGNIFILILVARLGGDYNWPELVGASIVAGVVVLLIGPLGLTDWLTRWIPVPIVFGLLAGAVLPFVIEMFSLLGEAPLVVGATLVVYIGARRWAEPRVPAILLAVAVAIAVSWISGDFVTEPIALSLPTPVLTAPDFSPAAILTLSPVLVILITVQANVPSLVFLVEQGYKPKAAVVNAVSGVGTAAGSLLGPTGISLSLPATALLAGPEAGPLPTRYWSVYVAALAGIAIAVLAGFAVSISPALPVSLLGVAIGLAVLGLLATALPRLAGGPLTWGPMFAFGLAASDVSLLGLSEFFWAIVAGVAVSLLLEREGWEQNLRSTGP